MRRLLLTIAMLLMGIALVGAAAGTLVGSQLQPLAQAVGTSASPAAAVLGLGLFVAAFNPGGNKGWVLAGILYGLVVLGFQVAGLVQHNQPIQITPVIIGLLFSLLLIATYPQRKRPAAPPATPQSAPMPAPAPVAVAPPTDEKTAAESQPGPEKKDE